MLQFDGDLYILLVRAIFLDSGAIGYLLIASPLIIISWLLPWYLRSSHFKNLKGMRGETKVKSALRRGLDYRQYHMFHDLTLPTQGGSTQIDHIVVSRFGIFIIEIKNMRGWIYGGAKQSKWTQVIYGRKSGFQNPIKQNYKHVKALQEILCVEGVEESCLHNVVAFVGLAVPKTAMPANVNWGVRSYSIVNRIHKIAS